MSKQRKERPGFVLYFDLYPALQLLSDSQRGRMLSAMFEYGTSGLYPDFDYNTEPQLCMAWAMIQPRLDNDSEKYEERKLNNTYASYCAACNRNGETPKVFEEWKIWQADIKNKGISQELKNQEIDYPDCLK